MLKQLSGLDATFLYMETPSTFGHVTGLMIFEPTPGFDPVSAVYGKFESMVGHLEPMRRRLVDVPLGLDHPYWVDDPDFDIDYHIREINVASPGRVDQLGEQVARIVGRPMDRSRPLWEVYVIQGLESGRWALLTKYHHATIDGAAGQLMLSMVLDTDRDAPPPEPSPAWEPDDVPKNAELLGRAMRNLVGSPVRAVRLQTRVVRQLADAAGITGVSEAAAKVGSAVKKLTAPGDSGRPRVSLPKVSAPPTPWNRSITPNRRFAMRTTSLANIKRLKDATGATVNDVVMAICAGGLRAYLIHHDALPDRPLRAMVPVSIRTGDEADPWTNRVSGIVAELPTDCADPLERIERCHEAMNTAKKQLDLVPASTLVDAAQFSAPVVATSAARLASRLRVGDRVALPFNLVISNVPGPREPLYFAGSKLEHQFPVSIVTDGQGLNITVQSYLDVLDFGFIVDRELVPDVWVLADMHVAEISRLFDATGAEWAEPPRDPFPRRGSLKRGVAQAARTKSASKKAPAEKAATKKGTAGKKTVARKATKKTARKRAR